MSVESQDFKSIGSAASAIVNAKTGRPSDFTEEIAAEICARIASNEKVSTICKDDHMPSPSTVYLWLTKYPIFSEQYAKAQADRTHAMAEELLDIADDGTNDWMERTSGDTVSWVTNGESLQRSRLRVDTRKWLMSKMLPKKYGEKVQQEISGPDGSPLIGAAPPRELNDEARELLRQFLLQLTQPQPQVIDGEAEETT